MIKSSYTYNNNEKKIHSAAASAAAASNQTTKGFHFILYSFKFFAFVCECVRRCIANKQKRKWINRYANDAYTNVAWITTDFMHWNGMDSCSHARTSFLQRFFSFFLSLLFSVFAFKFFYFRNEINILANRIECTRQTQYILPISSKFA